MQWSLDLILVLLAFGLVAVMALGLWSERRRRQRLVAGYARLGFERLPEGHLAPLMGPDRFWLLRQPAWWRAAELARGERGGHDILQFRLTLPDAIGRGQHQTATLIRDAGDLPEFHIRPETLRDRMGNVLEDGGIDYPALSRYIGAYTTDGDGAERSEELLPGALLQRLHEDSGWCIEARGGHLLVFQGHKVCRGPADIEEQLDQALWICRNLTARA